MNDDNLNYIHGKLHGAVHMMAVSEAPLRERLEAAWTYMHPMFMQTSGLPGEIGRDLIKLRARMTAIPDVFRVMSDAEIRRIARLICDLETDVSYYVHRREEEDAPTCGAV